MVIDFRNEAADVQAALDLANEALDEVLVRKTLFTALPGNVNTQPVGYRVLKIPAVQQGDGTVPLITVMSAADASDRIRQLPEQNILLLLLRISTPVF